MYQVQKQKGITLIALVITTIVLIILAGVAINLTIGENGILTRTQNAKKQSENDTVKENIETAVLQVYLPKEVTLTPDDTTENLWHINYGESEE